MHASPREPHVVETAAEIAVVARALEGSESIPLDVESNGLHAYRAILCTMQLARVEGGEVVDVFVIDTITAGDEALAPLREALSANGPPKVIHDLAFDARILVQHGIVLGRVVDTAITARFLGVAQTGLSSLLASRVGVTISKELQHHDWAKRPLDAEVLPYLATDVLHLPALARSLQADALERDVLPEIEAETEYRLAGAIASRDDEDPRPPYARIKGAGSLDPLSLAVLRRVAQVREDASRRWNVPPFKALGNDVLLELARKRPTELRAVRGLDRGRGASLLGALRRAIGEGTADGDVPKEERAAFFTEPPRPPRAEIDARRAIEQRLSSWRRKTAKERNVDEQVVLPGHCVTDVVERVPADLDALAAIPGIGARRVERDGAAILALLSHAPLARGMPI